MDNIVITGMGAICAIGNDCFEMLQTLRYDLTDIRSDNCFSSDFPDIPVGKVSVTDEQMKKAFGLEDSTVSRTMLMALWAIREAMEDGIVNKQCELEEGHLRVAFVNGTTVGGMDLTEREFPALRDGEGNAACMTVHDCGATTSSIAGHFPVFCESTTVSTACSSGANAIAVGAELLRSGRADIVVAGGTEALTKFHLSGFNSLMILDHEPCRPFDKNRAGLNLGEGAAYIVMQREQSVRLFNVRYGQLYNLNIKAFFTGYGNACDAFHQTATSPDGEGPYLAMTEALAMAGLKPGQIDYVNAHGTGTPNNDQCESVALKRVFGERMPAVSSTKGYTGHATSAAGAIESVITLFGLMSGFFPINRGWKEADEALIRPEVTLCWKNDVEHVMCNSFGFGGNDTSLIFSRNPVSASRETIEATAEIEACELARVEVRDVAELSGISEFVKPIEARRMSRLMKAAMLSSMRVLNVAGVESPDAIITATAYGAVELSERLLNQLVDGETLKPTWFMQSTHNTIAGELAVRTKCHGYNITYSHGNQSLQWALDDAKRLIRQGRCRTVLVECHDETTPLFRQLMERVGRPCQEEEVKSIAILLSCGKSSH